MAKTLNANPTTASAKSAPTAKNHQVMDLLLREDGATLDAMSSLAGWQPHSTRSFMTGLKKKGHVIESDKVDGIRSYRILPSGGA